MRIYRRLDNEVLYRRVILTIKVKNIDGELLYLLCAQSAQTAVAHDEIVVYLLYLVLGYVHGNDLADDRYAQALLERAYHNKIRKMYPRVFFLHRSGHDLHADIVVYRSGRDDRIAAGRVREQVEKLCHERDDLIHVKIKVGELVPRRERKAGYVFIPPAQLCCDKFAVIYKSYLPSAILYLIHYSTKSRT